MAMNIKDIQDLTDIQIELIDDLDVKIAMKKKYMNDLKLKRVRNPGMTFDEQLQINADIDGLTKEYEDLMEEKMRIINAKKEYIRLSKEAKAAIEAMENLKNEFDLAV